MFHLRQIADTYQDELIEPGHGNAARKANFSNLEGLIARYMSEMNAARSERLRGPQVAAPTPGAGRVASLVAFHERQQQNTTREDRTAALIIKLQIWLHRQGAVLTRDGKIVWSKSTARVVYDKELEQVMTTVRIRGGLLYGMDGQALDTKLMVTAFAGPGWGIFVVSGEGALHVASHQVGKRHHSSLLAAAPVACAGELICSKGRLVRISNKSGHYMPEPYFLAQVVRHFGQQGVNTDSFSVLTVDKSGKTEFPTGRAFLNSMCIPVLVTPVGSAGANNYAPGKSADGYESYKSPGGARPGGAYGAPEYELAPNPRYVDPPGAGKPQYEYNIPGFE